MKLKKVTIANLQKHYDSYYDEEEVSCKYSDCTSCHDGNTVFDGYGDR